MYSSYYDHTKCRDEDDRGILGGLVWARQMPYGVRSVLDWTLAIAQGAGPETSRIYSTSDDRSHENRRAEGTGNPGPADESLPDQPYGYHHTWGSHVYVAALSWHIMMEMRRNSLPSTSRH